LLLYNIQITIKAKTEVKMLFNRLNLIKHLDIDDAIKIVKSKNLYLLQQLS